MADIGLCTDHQAGRLFETLKKDPSRVGMGYSEFHAGFSSLQDPKGPITYSPGHSSLLFPVTQSVTGTGKRQIRQPLDMNQFKKGERWLNLDLADRDFYHDTKPITEPLQQSALFMAPVDRFSREANHRELFIRQEQQKKHQLLQERVLNKSNVLNMYEDIRSRAELKNQNRETNNIHSMQNRSQLYGELIKMSEKPSNL